MIQVHEPDWMKYMDGNLFITDQEVKEAFGISIEADTNRLIYQKAIPEPSERIARNKERPERMLWKVSDLRKVFKEG